MVKVLILGAAGFLGSNFVNSFMIQPSETYDIIGVDNVSTFSSLKNLGAHLNSRRFRFHLTNVMDLDNLEKIIKFSQPDIVINNIPSLVASPGLLNVVDKSKQYNVSKFISISNDGNVGFTDNTHTYVKMCNVYGARQHITRLVPQTIFNAINGKCDEINSMEFSVGRWLYVQDAFRAILHIIEKGEAGLHYEVGSEHIMSSIDIINKIYNVVGLPSPKCVSHSVSSNTQHPNTNFVNVRDVGWRPQYKFDEALEHTVSWYAATPNRWAFEG